MIKTKPLKIAVLFITLLASLNSNAQNVWLNDTSNFVALEFVKPSFDEGNDETNFITGVYNFSLGVNVSEKSRILFELPFTHFGIDADLGDKETGLGNMYIGYRLKIKKTISAELGLILPTANDNKIYAAALGELSDYNRFEMYNKEVVALSAQVKLEDALSEEGFFYKFNSGLLLLRYRSIDEIYLDIAAQLGYRNTNGLGFLAGIAGRFGLEEDAKIGQERDNTTLYFGAGLSYLRNNFEPSLTIRLPMDDNPIIKTVKYSVGISILYHL